MIEGKHLVISDLDSTLADIDHRLPLILEGKPDWAEFFRRCPEDKPIWHNIELLRALRYRDPATSGVYHRTRIVIITGRSNEVREETITWLRQHAVPYDDLLMRPAKSRKADDKLKKELFKQAGYRPAQVALVLEDRARVVKMWREMGIPCLQVADGDF